MDLIIVCITSVSACKHTMIRIKTYYNTHVINYDVTLWIYIITLGPSGVITIVYLKCISLFRDMLKFN